MQVTTTCALDRRRKKKDDTFPLVIRVTYDRTPRCYALGMGLKVSDFNKLSAPRLGEHLTQVRDRVREAEDRAKEIIKVLEPFSFAGFRQAFFKRKSGGALEKKKKGAVLGQAAEIATAEGERGIGERKKITVIRERPEPEGYTFSGHTKRYGKRKYPRIRSNVDYTPLGPLAEIFGDYIRELEKEERIGTSEGYFTSLMSLLKFRKRLRMEDITRDFLRSYDSWMRARGSGDTTIGIYLRNLRTLFNLQVEDGLISRDLYPFGKGRKKYQIPTGKNVKKTLEIEQIKLLFDYEPKTAAEQLARDMWFFLFFGNGMNPKDLAYLKRKHYDGEFIRFVRAKTKNTTRSQPPTITVSVNDDMRQFMDRWGNQDKDPESYIFPVLKPGLSAIRARELVQLFIKGINKGMRAIGKEVGIKEKVTCMAARHSYATLLRRAGATAEYIREALGHLSLSTTENYLAKLFQDEKIKEVSQKLLDFKNLPSLPPLRPVPAAGVQPLKTAPLVVDIFGPQAVRLQPCILPATDAKAV